MVPKKKFLTPAQALEQLRKYCSYQERSHQEVRYKLLSLGLKGNDLENVLAKLIEEGFLNEERFAIAFAGGKFRMKHWGKNKIMHALKQKGVSDYCIEKALKTIPEQDYDDTLMKLIQKKAATINGESKAIRKQKLINFLAQKGYAVGLVRKAVTKYVDEQ